VLGLCKGLEVRVLELLPDPARITPEPKALSRDEWLRILEVTKSLAETAEGMVRFAGRFRRPESRDTRAGPSSDPRSGSRRRPHPRSRR
jgi:hypothetical protein